MNSPDDVRPPLTGHRTTVDASPQRILVPDGGMRVVQVCVAIFLGLLVWWPLVILAVAVLVPALAVLAVLAAALAAVAVPPWLLVRRIRGRDRAQRSTLFLHRSRP